MTANTITIPALSRLVKVLNDSRLEVMEIKVRTELGQTSPETASELLKEIRDRINSAFQGQP